MNVLMIPEQNLKEFFFLDEKQCQNLETSKNHETVLVVFTSGLLLM